MQYYLPWQYSREDEPTATLFDAPTLANDYSIETWELESMVDWLYACYHTRALTEKSTGLPLSRIGTREFLEKLLQSIACRQGFGDVVAEGLVRAAEKIPEKARALLGRFVAPIGMHDMFPPRVYVVNALLYPMEPRVHHNLLHELGFVMAAWAANQAQPSATPVTTKLFRDIARAFWGSEEAADVTSYDGKALAARKIQNRTYIRDSLGLCDFNYPITYSFNTPDHLGDPKLEAKIFTVVTGFDGTDLDRYAERIFNLQRAIMVREGRRVPQADFPPAFNFTEPLQAIPNSDLAVVPGPGNEPVPIKGKILDRDKFTGMLKEYYRLWGWDEATGLPRAETLTALGLDDLLSTFQ
jgi:aldehyde:ferredoxin oxidoreductase